ncbi:MAG: 50S ribosomal protein L17 [Planctomycetota bacterium]|nr:50S ribosomal protein L17 [Planctomycetota bacterium]
MRHRKRGRKLGRNSSHRKALLRNMTISLVERAGTEKEFLITTREKAKECRPFAEKLVTLGKKGTLHHRRRAAKLLSNAAAVKKIFAEIAPRYENRQGGYTRILRYPKSRLGDGGVQVLFGWVPGEPTAEEAAAPQKKKKKGGLKRLQEKLKGKPKEKG